MDSNKYLESYEKVLIAWMTVKDNYCTDDQQQQQHHQQENQISNNESFNLMSTFKSYSQTVLEAFVQSRLSYNFEADKVIISRFLFCFVNPINYYLSITIVSSDRDFLKAID